MGILLELERVYLGDQKSESKPSRNALNEIDYFSTVSGGGWGSSSYLSYLYQKNKYGVQEHARYPTFNSFEIYLANWADRKYAHYQFSYFVRDLFFKAGSKVSSDVIMDRLNAGYLGWSYRKSVEQKISQMERRPFDQDSVDPIKLGDIFILNSSTEIPNLPMLIANTTNIDNFFSVPFTPDRLQFWGVSQYTLTKTKGAHYYPVTAGTVLNLNDLRQIPLAAGIKASSSVPGFIGSSFFKSNKGQKNYYLRLQDGGITDNQGLHSVKSILNQENIKEKENRIMIIVDASGSGIPTSRPKRKNARRNYSLLRIATSATPDAQYPLMRERIQQLEYEYDCTVIYLGTEVLLNSDLGLEGIPSKKLIKKKSEVEELFYSTYKALLTDDEYYSKRVSIEERQLLYEYIRSEVPTWFSAKNSTKGGKYLIDPEETKGSAKIMLLAGRGVVQLKKKEILDALKFNNNNGFK